GDRSCHRAVGLSRFAKSSAASRPTTRSPLHRLVVGSCSNRSVEERCTSATTAVRSARRSSILWLWRAVHSALSSRPLSQSRLADSTRGCVFISRGRDLGPCQVVQSFV